MTYYLGIDGGGTKTTAVVADETGKIICKAVGKTINFYGVGFAESRKNLEEIICEIKEKTGITVFRSTFIGCSALDSRADRDTIVALCNGIIESEKIEMNSDLFIALKASQGNCVAVCGTGSMAIGEKKDGSIIIKGGWGHILGDEGSAYSIALTALKKCCLLCDKNDYSSLLEEAKKYFKTESFRKIIDVIYSPENNKDYIAGFASCVGALAEDGDFSACAIIKNEALAFSETVKPLITELEKPAHLSLYGGVFKNNNLFREIFCNEMEKAFDDIRIDILSTPAEEGALKAAMELQ